MTKTFAELGLTEQTLQALRDVGYESPSPIQEQAIPPLLEGRDVIGQAQTGTGKTAAFGLPIVQYVDPAEHEVQALVLTPTRELCIQVTQALRAYGAHGRRGRGGGVRRRPDPHPAGPIARRWSHRRGHRGPCARPDLAQLDRAARLSLRGARRGGRDARPRLLGGRREDPLDDPLGASDRPVLGDDAAADPQARRQVHVRPGDHPGRGHHTHDRHGGPVPAPGGDA